jgi:hypothetical protein
VLQFCVIPISHLGSLSLSLSLCLCLSDIECDSILGLFAFCTICILLVGGGFGVFGHHFFVVVLWMVSVMMF